MRLLFSLCWKMSMKLVPWKLEQIEADLEQECLSSFLALDEGQVLGFVAIQETLYEAEVLQTSMPFRGKA